MRYLKVHSVNSSLDHFLIRDTLVKGKGFAEETWEEIRDTLACKTKPGKYCKGFLFNLILTVSLVFAAELYLEHICKASYSNGSVYELRN
jgi:hypothetical protein